MTTLDFTPTHIPPEKPGVSICAAARMLSRLQTLSLRVNVVKRMLSMSQALVLHMPLSAWTDARGLISYRSAVQRSLALQPAGAPTLLVMPPSVSTEIGREFSWQA
jgi:hypothetical protein